MKKPKIQWKINQLLTFEKNLNNIKKQNNYNRKQVKKLLNNSNNK